VAAVCVILPSLPSRTAASNSSSIFPNSTSTDSDNPCFTSTSLCDWASSYIARAADRNATSDVAVGLNRNVLPSSCCSRAASAPIWARWAIGTDSIVRRRSRLRDVAARESINPFRWSVITWPIRAASA